MLLPSCTKSRSVRINEKLEERIGLITLSGDADHILRTGDRREYEGRPLSWIIGIEFDLATAGVWRHRLTLPY